jgi:HPt (histidine-containing phosphotransfer) domain-containing protein
MDIHALAENLGLDEAAYRGLLEVFVRESREDLKRLIAALAEGDCIGAAEAAHSLRGAAGNLDLREILLLAGELESRAREGSLEKLSGLVETASAHLEALAGCIAT